MNINPSQYPRVVSCLFFVFILLFSAMAQASVLQKMARILPDVPQSKIKEVFDTLESLRISKNLPKNEVRQLVLALDDPTYLIKPSPDGLFGSRLHAVFFFSRFDLYKDGDTLFTQLFTKKNGEKLEELPFEEAKRNWENFLNAAIEANKLGRTQTTNTDLEAAAMSFIHQRFPDKYQHLLEEGSRDFVTRDSMGLFLDRNFHVDHYINPHFTLTPEDPYHNLVMKTILGEFIFDANGRETLINSKEFVVKIWNDVRDEISRVPSTEGVTSFAFLELIINSTVELRRLQSSSIGDNDFLKAVLEAAREDDRLAQVVEVVQKFTSNPSNALENYAESLLAAIQEVAL